MKILLGQKPASFQYGTLLSQIILAITCPYLANFPNQIGNIVFWYLNFRSEIFKYRLDTLRMGHFKSNFRSETLFFLVVSALKSEWFWLNCCYFNTCVSDSFCLLPAGTQQSLQWETVKTSFQARDKHCKRKNSTWKTKFWSVLTV